MIKISVLMPTYNHEKFISQAIESFLKQKTVFETELLINDDCSTDSTYQIASKYQQDYPDKIRLIRSEKNEGLLRAYKSLIRISKGKYLSILESDDIYVDPYKLQKQVDFLELNPEYGLIASNFSKIDETGKIFDTTHNLFYKTLNDNWYSHFLKVQELGAVTVCFSKEIFNKYCKIDDYIKLNFKTFDYPVWLSISKHSKCKYIDDVTASYRILRSSISNNIDYNKRLDFENSVSEIQKYIIDLFGLGELSLKEFKEYQTMRYINVCIDLKKYKEYFKYAKKMKPVEFKFQILHYFPFLWLFQHKIRGF